MAPDADATPQSWPQDAYPTPEQLAEWLTRCTDEERITLCSKMLDSADRATRCLFENHDGLRREVQYLSRLQPPATSTDPVSLPDGSDATGPSGKWPSTTGSTDDR